MLASDFSELVWVTLGIVSGVVLACLMGGAATAGVVVVLTKQKKHWWLTLPLAAIWFAIGWTVMSCLDL